MYLINGMLNTFTLWITVLSVPAAALGLWIGGRIDLKLSEKKANLIMNLVFILGGLSILVKALIFKA